MFKLSRTGATALSHRQLGTVIGKQLIPLAIVIMAFLLMQDRIPEIDISKVWASLQYVTLEEWSLALLATSASFWAVGQYDQVIHGLLGTGTNTQSARISGSSAIAISQFAGFGILSSALVRWHMLPGLSLSRSLQISVTVSGSFLTAWAIITSTIILIAGEEFSGLQSLAIVVIGLSIIGICLLAWQPIALGSLPTLRVVVTIVATAFVDTFFAGAALYILLPQDIDISPITLFAAFLVALGCGLVGGTPGGVGPFEVGILAMLPQIPQESLLASIVAFRLTYYVIPAGLALIVLMLGFRSAQEPESTEILPPTSSPFLAPELSRSLWSAPRAEVNLIRQGEFSLLKTGGTACALVAKSGQNLIMLSDPITSLKEPVLNGFTDLAERLLRGPIIYKCSARSAVFTRDLGWSTIAIAQEAWLRPAAFNTEGANYRQLRRFLRKSDQAGVSIVEGGSRLPIDKMADLSSAWTKSHGGERGFSMGVFDPDYVSCQRVFLAYLNDDLVAFITLHEVNREWTLDLMRQSDDMPDGTMHRLVCSAIESAASIGCPRLSLAAVPNPLTIETPVIKTIHRLLIAKSNTSGLRRFKSSFAPNWETLYATAPSKYVLITGLIAVLREVTRSTR